jgi:uncharacterized protein (TIGR00299 family) protein
MLLGALLDTDREGGRLQDELRRAVDALGLDGVSVEVVRDVEWGVSCTRVRVDDGGAAPLRHLADMETILDAAPLYPAVKERAVAAVRRLAEVEAGIHGCSTQEIHFHEVGAVDTLVDVVGAFTLVEALGVEQVFVGAIPVGGGTVEIAHGRMGIPAPATAALLHGYAITGGPEPRELTTPTGSLLVSQLGAKGGGLPRMIVEQVGYGAGTMKLEHGPNVLRVLLGRDDGPEPSGDVVVELQTNLDDVSPEVIGHAVRSLRGAGALDVWTVPAQTKKDRPGVVLHTLVDAEGEAGAVDLLFAQTGTLGVRRQVVARHVAGRGTIEVDVDGMRVRVKWGRWRGRLVSIAPEYEDCAAAAAASRLPLKDVMQSAVESARKLL